jgi:hypothetical protein
MALQLAVNSSVQSLRRSIAVQRPRFVGRFTTSFGESLMSVLRHLRIGVRLVCWLPLHSKLHITGAAAAASLEFRKDPELSLRRRWLGIS